MFGTPKNDTIITHSGIKKLNGNAGDDLFVTTARGLARVNGGSGNDTISYAAHTPPGGRRITGVIVDLRAGTSLGTTRYRLASLENVIGSAFNDEITADPGVTNNIEGGLGNDLIVGNDGDGDSVDGGLGVGAIAERDHRAGLFGRRVDHRIVARRGRGGPAPVDVEIAFFDHGNLLLARRVAPARGKGKPALRAAAAQIGNPGGCRRTFHRGDCGWHFLPFCSEFTAGG